MEVELVNLLDFAPFIVHGYRWLHEPD